MSVVKHTGARN